MEAIDEDAEPLRAAMAYDRLSGYLLDAEPELELARVEEQMLAASERAVELVPEEPPTPLRARVAAGLARSLLVARDYEGARRRGEEALAVARAAGSVGDEATALVIVSLLELRFGDVETARLLLRDADRAAAAAGNRPLELQARHALGVFELDLGNLAAACTALDQATELAERSGLAWSGYGIDSRVLRCIAHYAAGSWDEAERVATRGRRAPAGGVGGRPVRRGRPGPRRRRPSGWPASPPTAPPTRTSPTWPAAARPTWPAGRASWSAPASSPARPCRPRRRPAPPGC